MPSRSGFAGAALHRILGISVLLSFLSLAGCKTKDAAGAIFYISSTSLPSGSVSVGGGGYSASLQATGGIAPYTWTLLVPAVVNTTNAVPPGLTLNTSGTITGMATVAGTYNFIVQAADSGGLTVTAAETIVITAPLSIGASGTTLATVAVIGSPYQAASLGVSAGSGNVTCALNGGSLPAGLTITNATGAWAISGTVGLTDAVGNYVFTVKCTDSQSDVLVSGSITLTVASSSAPTNACPTGGSLGLLNGQYAFLLKGFDPAGNPDLIGGVFTANGAGALTGIVDMSLADGMHTGLPITFGSYTIGTAGNRGCLSITTGAEGTQNYRVSLGTVGTITVGAASNGYLIDADATGPFTSGTLRQQTPSAFSNAQINGNYAFGLAAIQNSGQGGGKSACVGVLSLSAGTVTGGQEDCNKNGLLNSTDGLTSFPLAPISVTSGGSYNIDGTSGRGTLSFTPSGRPSAVNAFVYAVSQNELLVLSNGPESSTAIFGGEMFHQAAGPFTDSFLSGKGVLYMAGVGTTGSAVSVGFLTTTGLAQTYSLTRYKNDSGVVSDQTTNSLSGAFTIASNGRVLLTGSGSIPVLYMVTTNTGFILNANSSVEIGFVEQQSSGPFSASSLSGIYAHGSVNPQSAGSSDVSGVASYDGIASVMDTFDVNSQGALSANNQTTSTYAIDSTGTGLSPSGCALTGNASTCKALFIIISPTQAFLIDATQSSGGNPDLSFVAK